MKAPKKPGMKMTAAAMMKMDKSADKAMTPAMMRKDIAADRKQLASKTVKKGKK